ncbi:hypothetical protein WG66_002457 [Moniliophthora roreri]|nr:hypothetical protein WG66_002457 [Moniliophthora roreri]
MLVSVSLVRHSSLRTVIWWLLAEQHIYPLVATECDAQHRPSSLPHEMIMLGSPLVVVIPTAPVIRVMPMHYIYRAGVAAPNTSCCQY